MKVPWPLMGPLSNSVLLVELQEGLDACAGGDGSEGNGGNEGTLGKVFLFFLGDLLRGSSSASSSDSEGIKRGFGLILNVFQYKYLPIQ